MRTLEEFKKLRRGKFKNVVKWAYVIPEHVIAVNDFMIKDKRVEVFMRDDQRFIGSIVLDGVSASEVMEQLFKKRS